MRQRVYRIAEKVAEVAPNLVAFENEKHTSI